MTTMIGTGLMAMPIVNGRISLMIVPMTPPPPLSRRTNPDTAPARRQRSICYACRAPQGHGAVVQW